MTIHSNPAVFDSALRWMGTVWTSGGLYSVTFGNRTPQTALRRLALPASDEQMSEAPDGAEDLVERLIAFANGVVEDFLDVSIDLRQRTPFQRRVIQQCRRIPSGETITYGELARLAGSPRAARAVGNTMASNRIPLVIPCHRVVASNGKLGGFSAPEGISMKRRLLGQESATEWCA